MTFYAEIPIEVPEPLHSSDIATWFEETYEQPYFYPKLPVYLCNETPDCMVGKMIGLTTTKTNTLKSPILQNNKFAMSIQLSGFSFTVNGKILYECLKHNEVIRVIPIGNKDSSTICNITGFRVINYAITTAFECSVNYNLK